VCGVLGGKQISGKKGRAMSGFEIGKNNKNTNTNMCVALPTPPLRHRTPKSIFLFFSFSELMKI
jgi:hypothetical protein